MTNVMNYDEAGSVCSTVKPQTQNRENFFFISDIMIELKTSNFLLLI
jgi:hypothetical protein